MMPLIRPYFCRCERQSITDIMVLVLAMRTFYYYISISIDTLQYYILCLLNHLYFNLIWFYSSIITLIKSSSAVICSLLIVHLVGCNVRGWANRSFSTMSCNCTFLSLLRFPCSCICICDVLPQCRRLLFFHPKGRKERQYINMRIISATIK